MNNLDTKRVWHECFESQAIHHKAQMQMKRSAAERVVVPKHGPPSHLGPIRHQGRNNKGRHDQKKSWSRCSPWPIPIPPASRAIASCVNTSRTMPLALH